MSALDDPVLRALETGWFLFPPIARKLERLSIPAVTGRYARSTRIGHWLINLVGNACFTATNADLKIREVRDHFSRRKQAFGWLIGASSTPGDLGVRLEVAGFEKHVEFAGLRLKNMSLAISGNPELRIDRATEAEQAHVVRLYRAAYPLPGDVADLLIDMHSSVGMTHYLAYVDGVPDPVAVASMLYMPDEPIAVLHGATTLEAYRKRGIYTSLIARRVADARSDGMRVAVMRADRKTSAPICEALGFQVYCDLNVYFWARDKPSGLIR